MSPEESRVAVSLGADRRPAALPAVIDQAVDAGELARS